MWWRLNTHVIIIVYEYMFLVFFVIFSINGYETKTAGTRSLDRAKGCPYHHDPRRSRDARRVCFTARSRPRHRLSHERNRGGKKFENRVSKYTSLSVWEMRRSWKYYRWMLRWDAGGNIETKKNLRFVLAFILPRTKHSLIVRPHFGQASCLIHPAPNLLQQEVGDSQPPGMILLV